MSRKINRQAIELIDRRLEGNAFAAACVAEKNARQLYIEVVKSLVGIKEIGSTNSGPEVNIFLATLGLSPGNSWCMAFQQTCLAYVEKKLNVTSPVAAFGLVTRVWTDTPETSRVKNIPLAGAIMILRHEKSEGKVKGHTGMVLDCDGELFHTIEGNSREGADNLVGGVSKSGEGVRFVTRKFDYKNYQEGSKDLLLLGFLKPF